ncbi:MAG: heme-binding protein [Planctomycetaceae bacterium]
MLRQTAALALVLSALVSPTAFADDKPAEKPLISTGRFELNLGGAELVLAAAQKKAAAMNVKVNIAIVDNGGHLLTFARMDGARPASGYTAMTKAISAATFRQESGTVPPNAEPDVLLNLSLQNAAAASGAKVTTLKGGVPIVIEGQVIGAVGVGGATGAQDAEVAKAGIDALYRELGTKRPE